MAELVLSDKKLSRQSARRLAEIITKHNPGSSLSVKILSRNNITDRYTCIEFKKQLKINMAMLQESNTGIGLAQIAKLASDYKFLNGELIVKEGN